MGGAGIHMLHTVKIPTGVRTNDKNEIEELLGKRSQGNDIENDKYFPISIGAPFPSTCLSSSPFSPPFCPSLL
jgi:hypothetical protein